MSMARRCARHSRIRRRRRGSRPSALPDAAQRFLEAVEALNGAIGEGKLAVAVSGGPDSLALLLLAHAAFPGRVLALTVDHGLRPESAAEADMVTRFCRDLGVGHRTLVLDGLDGAAGNIQARARERSEEHKSELQ